MGQGPSGIVTTAGIVVALAACTGATREPPPTLAGSRANILVILADDLGYSDIGSYGSEIRTPHLDRLAQEGVRLTRFRNSGRCCPSRAALLTGLHPTQTSSAAPASPRTPLRPSRVARSRRRRE